MKQFAGKTAFISGAGSGIGRGIATSLARRGARIAVVDIRAAAASETAELIRAAGGTAAAYELDVSDRVAFEEVAARAEAELGPVEVLANNAGVAMHGVPLHRISTSDWDWAIGVNIYGVINGIQTFVPRMLERGGEAHVVNTASIGGFQVNPNFLTGAYSMTKYAVVALSEALSQELEGTGIGVSVLAPAAVNTSIHLSERSRPERLGGACRRPENHFMGDLIKDGASPEEIGERVARAIEDGDFYVFTHPETLQWLERRHERIRRGFARAEEIGRELAAGGASRPAAAE